MKKEALTVAQALRFARHDFLNQLQVVLMHIDLGKITESKQAILKVSEEFKQLSILEKLGLPETVLWISTFGWHYTAFETRLSCEIESGHRSVDDLEVVTYLNRLFKKVTENLDELTEYEATIKVFAFSSNWSIEFTVSGTLDGKPKLPEAGKGFLVEESSTENLWIFKISGN